MILPWIISNTVLSTRMAALGSSMRLLILVCFALLTTASLQAQSSEITFYAGGFQGDSFLFKPPVLIDRVDAVYNDDFTGGVRYAYFFTDHFAGEAGIGFTPSTILGEGS